MKNHISIFLFLLFALFMQQCKNDVKVLAPYKDITVVYGLLDQNDTVHYIRINKAYLGAGNAFTMAQQYDSINYPVGTLTVKLQDINSNTTVTLDTTTVVSVSPGIFSYPYEVLYKTSEKLDSTHEYKLTITNNKTGKAITGSTNLLPDVIISPPQYMTTSDIVFDPDTNYPTVITWNSNARAIMYQLVLRFYYNEINTTNGDTNLKYIDWVFAPYVSPSPASGYYMQEKYTGKNFLQLLHAEISPVNGQPIKRVPVNVQVSFVSGSVDFYTYFELEQPSLTINQQRPAFSNLTNAIGIFSSRHTQSVFKLLSPVTIAMMDTSKLIAPLNFQPH